MTTNADELALMKRRVADLERHFRRWRWISFAALSVAALMIIYGSIRFRPLASGDIKLSGEGGGAKVFLGLTRHGSGLLGLSDSTSIQFLEAAEYRGRTVLSLAEIHPGQGAAIQLCDKDWSPRAELSIDGDGRVHLGIDMPRGRILAGEDVDGAPRIQILDEGGEVAWSAP